MKANLSRPVLIIQQTDIANRIRYSLEYDYSKGTYFITALSPNSYATIALSPRVLLCNVDTGKDIPATLFNRLKLCIEVLNLERDTNETE